MKKIIAFGASNSTKSINTQLARWAASQLENVETTLLDLNDFEMPIYSSDRETADGIHEKARQFKAHVDGADGIIISFAEHNGSYSSAFKNVFDWMSRIGRPIWSDKPMFLMGTSPGGRGATTVLETAASAFPHQGGIVAARFSLPSFGQNFDEVDGISNEELNSEFQIQAEKFSEAIK
ncbi:MAG: NAD(P)H-dependent oxidoreductase [Cyclobacteriaceae bacterium]